MDTDGSSTQLYNEITLTILRVAAHPAATRAAARNGDKQRGSLSSQENRETTQHRLYRGTYWMSFLTVLELTEVLSTPFYLPGMNHHLLPHGAEGQKGHAA